MGPISPGSRSSKALAQALVVDRQPNAGAMSRRAASPALLCSRSGSVMKPFLCTMESGCECERALFWGNQTTPRCVTRTDRQLGGGNVCPVLGFCDLLLHGKPGPSRTLFLHMGGVPTARGNQGVCARRSACGCIPETKTAQQGARRGGLSCHFFVRQS